MGNKKVQGEERYTLSHVIASESEAIQSPHRKKNWIGSSQRSSQ